jgi:hypothetical protein
MKQDKDVNLSLTEEEFTFIFKTMFTEFKEYPADFDNTDLSFVKLKKKLILGQKSISQKTIKE